MDFSKLRLGELIAGAAGVLLFVDVFLPWYAIGSLGGGLSEELARAARVDTTVSAWGILGFTRLLLLLTALAAIAAAVIALTQRSVALPVAASVIVTALGVLATLMVLYRLVNEPGPDELFDIKFGAYLGFLLTAAIAFGGFLSMQDEGASFSQAATDLQGRGHGPGQPGGSSDIPTQPAPPAGGSPAQGPGGSVPPAGSGPAGPGGQAPPPGGPPPGA